MTRIEKIRQMTDEELAEFLYDVSQKNQRACALLDASAVQDMADVALANYLSSADRHDCLHICPDNCPRDCSPGIEDLCAECALHWLQSEGPLMDGEG